MCDGGELLTIKIQLASFVCLMTETLNSVRPDQRLTPALSTILAVEVGGDLIISGTMRQLLILSLFRGKNQFVIDNKSNKVWNF